MRLIYVREVILDALSVPCSHAAPVFEDVRKLLDRSPGHPDVLAAFAGLEGATT